MPHELLKQELLDFNFDVAVTFFSDKQMKDETDKKPTVEPEKNKFSPSKGGSQFTQDEFEGMFGKAFTKK